MENVDVAGAPVSLLSPGPILSLGWTKTRELDVNLPPEGGLPGGGGISAEKE